jgi:hypothetical protein
VVLYEESIFGKNPTEESRLQFPLLNSLRGARTYIRSMRLNKWAHTYKKDVTRG